MFLTKFFKRKRSTDFKTVRVRDVRKVIKDFLPGVHGNTMLGNLKKYLWKLDK